MFHNLNKQFKSSKKKFLKALLSLNAEMVEEDELNNQNENGIQRALYMKKRYSLLHEGKFMHFPWKCYGIVPYFVLKTVRVGCNLNILNPQTETFMPSII